MRRARTAAHRSMRPGRKLAGPDRFFTRSDAKQVMVVFAMAFLLLILILLTSLMVIEPP